MEKEINSLALVNIMYADHFERELERAQENRKRWAAIEELGMEQLRAWGACSDTACSWLYCYEKAEMADFLRDPLLNKRERREHLGYEFDKIADFWRNVGQHFGEPTFWKNSKLRRLVLDIKERN